MKKSLLVTVAVCFAFGVAGGPAFSQVSTQGPKVNSPRNPYGTEGVGGCNPRPRHMFLGDSTLDDALTTVAVFLSIFIP